MPPQAAYGRDIAMAFTFWKREAPERHLAAEHRGGWYADPFGTAARRWHDSIDGWTDRVEGPGEPPDATGLARMDEAAASSGESTGSATPDGEPVPLSRPVDLKYMQRAARDR